MKGYVWILKSPQERKEKKRKETLNFQTKYRWIVLDGCNPKLKAHLQGTYKFGNLK
jgi:hypothetical protein